MAKTGRPSTFTQETADRICAMLAQGKSMRTVCKEDWAPPMETVFRWLRENEAFQQQYARAKQEAADALVEEMADIADAPPAYGPDGKIDNGDVQNRRLQIDTRKWLASKLKPKKYGDKLEVGGTGAGGAVMVQVVTGVPGDGDSPAD